MSKCPICGADEIPEQPYPGLHAATTIYECGCEIVQAIGSDEIYYDQRCDEPRKEKIDISALVEKAMQDPERKKRLQEIFKR
jgi:transcription initiation factor TFIIIB Brf1 subunit/transcription initiation factor TFIIB